MWFRYERGRKRGNMTNSEAVDLLMSSQYYERGYKQGVSDVLDKIRAEIAELHLIGYATVDGKREIASRAVMQIIDKYMSESENP
jgi:hypothetical protein